MFQATGLGLNSAIPRTRGVAFGGRAAVLRLSSRGGQETAQRGSG